MIKFACPGCNASFTVADEKAGKSGKCPKCQSQFVIPAASAGEGPPSTKTAAPPDDDLPVEIQPCPKCKTRLSVMPGDIGLDIECTNCQTVFKALKAGGAAPKSDSKPSRPPVDDEEDDRPKRKSRRDEDEEDEQPKRKSRREEDDEDDRPKRKSRRDEEEDEERPSKKSKSRRDEDEDDRPSKRAAKSADEDEDDRPSRRSRRGDDDENDRPSKYKKKKRSGGGGSTESKKTVAGMLGLFLGAWGVHKFYLGYSTAGIIQIVVTIFTCGTGGVIGFIEGIIYLTKSDEDFIETYQRNEKQWF
jgi:TM2 domain-containing membrane protein YozV